MIINAIIIFLLAVIISLLILILRHIKASQQNNNLIQQETHHLFHQIEAYHYIKDRLQLNQGLPYTNHWSASPDFLKIICNYCLDYKPETILECSSGLSSLVLAKCCEVNRTGHVYSLENEIEYANKTSSHIERYTLQNWIHIIHAPLEKTMTDNNEYLWYATDQLPEKSIDLLIIDGPPGYIQPESRFPALPLLYESLSDQCIIILDDAARPDEKQIVERWIATYPDLQHEYVHTERGCSILRLNKLT